jgi:hypothetical protein
MRRVTDQLLIQFEIRLQKLLHFAKRFRHLRSSRKKHA